MSNNLPATLITGAGGFIASYLAEAVLPQAASLRCFVHYNSRGDPGLLNLLPSATLREMEIIAGDLRDLDALQKACQGVELLLHLGALISIPYSYRHPQEVVQTNVNGTLNVLLAARQANLSRVVHTSTSEVYGTARRVPIDEDHPLQGQSPYSASKIAADKLAESFYRSYDLPVVTLRPFNTYGPRQSARAVIPTIISQALTQSEVHLGNLQARRDLTYVADTVEGFLLAAQLPGLEGQTINLGSGVEISIGDLAKQIIALIGSPVELVEDPSRLRPEKSEVERLLADNSRAKKLLGWQPRTPLKQGLQHTIDWMAENIDLYQPERYQI
jgi:NAD dependent epimerase/dehydratase